MNTTTSILSAKGVVLAIMACGLAIASAQTIDTSKGTILDSASSPSGTVKKLPGAAKLTAVVEPVQKDAKAGGEVSFTPGGDLVNVNGTITGLEPMRAYQVIVDLPEKPAPAGPASGQSPNSGTPAAGAPDAGAPDSPVPAAGTPAAGQPDGESRPGASGAGTSGTSVSGTRTPRIAGSNEPDSKPPTDAGNLGMITADANGSLLINASLKNVDQTADPGLIIGRAITIKTANEDASAMVAVASGVISIPLEDNKTAAADTAETP